LLKMGFFRIIIFRTLFKQTHNNKKYLTQKGHGIY